ncbi:hypothetical protein Pst134EA_011609 [Puccinia striiformis f. sp. tritici]|nr:hypothetical protein Pst134EA_011609 [Puccinia striiformis f. sp. tritici]KAH9467987.1 hypothetical protein Pst134EA_011609 [Puccinia striiformis f. sp. tritici]
MTGKPVNKSQGSGKEMARTKHTRRKNKKVSVVVPTEQQEENFTEEEIDGLIDQAEQHLILSEFDTAKSLCQRVINRNDTHLRALENLALCELELGDLKSARKLFQKCLSHSSSNPQPTVHLYLAQLSNSPKESLNHFKKALDLLKIKLNTILESKQVNTEDNQSSVNTVHWSIDESQIRRSCSRALVGMTEIYLTDLCFEESAEAKCLEYLAMASSLDPTDPEPLQTLASVRLSQSETNLAKEALLLSWSLWRDKVPIPKRNTTSGRYYQANEQEMIQDPDEDQTEADGDRTMDSIDSQMIISEDALIEEELEEDKKQGDINLPPIESRIQWSKLAIECEMWNSAIEVLHQCEAENDQDGEIEYLLALSWHLLGQSRPNTTDTTPPTVTSKVLSATIEALGQPPSSINPFSDFAVGDGLGKMECWLEAKECIETCLQLYAKLGDDSGIDQSILTHLEELKVELSNAGLPIQNTNNDDDQDDEDDDQSATNDADWVDASDVEMA